MINKILVVSFEYPPTIGGAGSCIKDLAENLNKYDDIKLDLVTEYVNEEISTERKNGSLNIIEVKSKKGIRPLMYWNELRNLELDTYKYIILNDSRAVMCGVLFFSGSLIEKSVVYLHGREPEEIFINPNKLLKTINYKKRYSEFLKKCYKIISVSKFMKNKFLNITKLNNLDNKITVIYNGVDDSIFYEEKIDLYSKYNISKENILLLSVSRIVKDKGYEVNYNLFKKILTYNENFHWIIVGDGDYLKELKEKAKIDNMENFITFVGGVRRQDLRYYYSSVQVFWLLSNYQESLGLSYIESQFCNTFPIAKNKSGERETIHDSFGLLENDNQKIIDFIVNKSFLKFKRDNNFKEHLEKFRIRNTVKKLREELDL